MEKRPIRLTDCFKTYTYDQDKVFTPEETVERFLKRLSAVDLDILKEVRRIDNGRLDIPVYFSVTGKDARDIIGNKKQMGKGGTPAQSRASACMELAERFSFFSFIKNPDNFIVDTYPNLKAAGQPLMPLEQLLQSVHDQTTDVVLLEQLLAEVPIQWTWATNLNRREEVLVPYSWFYAINEFNGPSAGNTYEEAICQGICEIVERHVCAVVSHDEVRVPRIDPASARDPVSRELIRKFTRHGIEIYLNDFSLDTGIPTIGAMAVDPSTFPATSEIVYTAGTTPDPEKALIRALTEVAQLAGDFNTKSNYVASGLPKPLAMDEVGYLTHDQPMVDLHSLPNLGDNNMRVEVENCMAALARLGMEVYIINTQHPQLQMSTIYTIVPGAHFRERSRSQNAGLFATKLMAELITDPVESNARLLRARKLLPDAYYIEFFLGRNLLTMGRNDEALAHFERALTLDPLEEDLPYIYSYLGSCLKDLSQYREAIDVLEKGADIDKTRPDLHNMLGFCHFKLGEYETAVTHFTKTVELNPSSAIDYANLGVNYRKLSRNNEAIKYFQLSLSLDPTIEFARDNLEQLLDS
ncbi:MAG: YcaO-like family protein [Desulfobacterales bacterium]|nr:YcaO-like family protein [Desulfobacterales bacterium]